MATTRLVTGPVNVKSTAIATLAIIATVVFLNWSQNLFAPIVLSVLLSYALYPVVSFFNLLRLPNWLGAAIVLAGVIGVGFWGATSLQSQAEILLDKVPVALERFSKRPAEPDELAPSVLDKLQVAAEKLEQATTEASVLNGTSAAAKKKNDGLTRVVVEEKPFDLMDFLLGGSMSMLVVVSQTVSVLLLVFFILASGRLYKEKLVRISGDTFSEKRLTVTILEDINRQLRLFFFVMLLGALFVGLLTWLAFWWLGLEQAALWGVIAGLASMIPYLGPGIVFLLTGVVAFLQFGTLAMAFAIAATSLIITSIQGNLLTPWMTSKASSMNAVGIFISLLFWGWLWGPIGLIVATPIQLVVKAICDHVENLQNFGELLAD